MELDLSTVTVPIENMMKRLTVNSVFGEPIKEGDQTVIPVAQVSYGFGFGAGWGSGAAEAEGEERPANAGGRGVHDGGGHGGGAMGKAQPAGALRITADGVHFEPVMDPKAIALAGIAMVAWNVFWIAATVRAFTKR
jgi:uncharacterized spore protein YtfJ